MTTSAVIRVAARELYQAAEFAVATATEAPTEPGPVATAPEAPTEPTYLNRVGWDGDC